MSDVNHEWSYMICDDQFAGPVSEAEFIAGIKSGQIQPTTKVHSITRTKGTWVQANQIPAVKSVFAKSPAPLVQSAVNENVLTKKNAVILTVALVGIFGLMIALLIVAMSEPTSPPSDEIVKPLEPIESVEAVEVAEKTPLDAEQLKAKEKIEEIENDFERFGDRQGGLEILEQAESAHPGDFVEQLAYFWAERNKPKSPPTPPTLPASTGTLGGARAAGMDLAKKIIGEEGVFPTNAKYPWANVKAELMRDTGPHKLYRVTGTVESGSRSAKWVSHILSDNEVYACTGVYVNGIEVWSLPD